MRHILFLISFLVGPHPLFAEPMDLDVAGAQAKYDAQKSIADRAKARMDERERDYRRVESEYFDALSREKQAQASLATAQDRLQTLNSEISSLESRLSSIQSDIADLERNQRRLEQQVRDLRHDLQHVDEELSAEKAKPTPDAAKVAQLENQHENIENQIRDLERRIDRLQDDIQDRRRDYTDTQNKLAQSNRDRQQQLLVISDCQDAVRRAADFVRLCQSRLSDAKSSFSFAQAEYQQEERLARQAYDYLQVVVANYNRERDKVVALATQTGNRDGGREASERASAPGSIDGKAWAIRQGQAVGTAEAKVRDRSRGYREGREKGATLSQVASQYRDGLVAGREWAVVKAAKEELPRGYNDSLSALLSGPPKNAATLDISESVPEGSGGGQELSAKPKPVGAHTAPAFGIPSDPAYQVPPAGSIAVSVPARDNRYFSAPCQSLILPEFGPLCARVYDENYGSGYASGYRSLYSQSFASAYDANIKAAYDGALAQSFADEFGAGLAQGAGELGVLNGFAEKMPVAAAEQYAAGKKAFADQMATGYLPVVRALDIVDSNRDGLFTPGEVAKLQLVLDNYGGLATPQGRLQARVTKIIGFEAVSASVRELPSIDGETRATIVGVVSAKVGAAYPKRKIRMEGVIEGGSVAFGFAVEKEVHFPVELEAVTFSKKPKINETVTASFRYRNLTMDRTPEAKLTLLTRPAVMAITSEKLTVPAIDPGQAVEVTAPAKPGMWVGENTEVVFESQIENVGGIEKLVQPHSQLVPIDRDGALLLYDNSGQPIPGSTISVKAGSVVSFQAQFKYLRPHNLPGPFVVRATSTSVPQITHASGSTTGVNYGSYGPGMTASKIRFSYTVPASLAGKKEWAMITLYNGNVVLHAMQVYLDIR